LEEFLVLCEPHAESEKVAEAAEDSKMGACNAWTIYDGLDIDDDDMTAPSQL
jgi:hypothetical protein